MCASSQMSASFRKRRYTVLPQMSTLQSVCIMHGSVQFVKHVHCAQNVQHVQLIEVKEVTYYIKLLVDQSTKTYNSVTFL